MTACFVQLPKLTVRLPIAPVGPWAPGWTPSAGRGGWEGPSTLSSLAQGKPVGKSCARPRAWSNRKPAAQRPDLCTDLCTRRCGTGETRETPARRHERATSVRRGQRRHWRTGRDARDARRMAHNPEVEGSNPSPATKARGPFSNRERASDASFVNRFCKRRARSRCLASTRVNSRALVLACRAGDLERGQRPADPATHAVPQANMLPNSP